MSNKPKTSKLSRRIPLIRAQLLPVSPATARAFSLRYHLALVAMRQGRGNADLASELIRTLFLTYLVCQKDKLDLTIDTFLSAEAVLRACIHDSIAPGAWRIAEEQCTSVEAVLCAHDVQLACTPLHRIEVARKQLDRLLKAGSFPEIRTMHGLTAE